MDGAGGARSRGADRLEDAAEEASYWGGGAAAHAPVRALRAPRAAASQRPATWAAVAGLAHSNFSEGALRRSRSLPLRCARPSRGATPDAHSDAGAPAPQRVPPTWGGSAPGPAAAAAPASAADAELALELKAQGNKLLQSGQTEAAEIVYTEALKARPWSMQRGLRRSILTRRWPARASPLRAACAASGRRPRRARALGRCTASRVAAARSAPRRPLCATRCPHAAVPRAADAPSLARRALQHDPAAHTVLANRALARCKLGRLGDAVADAKQVVTLAPSWSKGHARLGACLQAALRYNDAVAAFERAAWLARAHDNDDAAQQVRALRCL